MSKASQSKALHKELKKTIKKMKKMQRKIAADTQPTSMHELDTLVGLGRRYGEIIVALQANQPRSVAQSKK